MTDTRGQALVETLWLVPVTAAVVTGVIGAGVWLSARSVAGSAAEAGAIAAIQDRDPVATAERAVPRWGRASVEVDRRSTSVAVRVVPTALPRWLAEMAGAKAAVVVGER